MQTVAHPVTKIPESGSIRLPRDVWRTMREIAEGLGGATYTVSCMVCLRVVEYLVDEGISFSTPVIRTLASDTMGTGFTLPPEGWELVRRLAPEFMSPRSASAVITQVVRTVGALRERDELPEMVSRLLGDV